MSSYPKLRIDNRWIGSLRGEKEVVNPFIPNGFFNEFERMPEGVVEEVSTLLLSNKECPYRCLMCDLWKHTSDETVPLGAIPSQLEYALSRLPRTHHLKLYNSGSFFDRSAIPFEDYQPIASLIQTYQSVIVESHTSFIGADTLYFNELIQGSLELAIGLETSHPDILPRLNKRMTLSDFEHAVGFLNSEGIPTRAFILLSPPFLTEAEGIKWAKRSIDFAFNVGVSTCVVIPVRAGNGFMDHLARAGYFSEPGLQALEEVLGYGIGLKRGRVFADLWDLDRFSSCAYCLEKRRDRLHQMNLQQLVLPEIQCACLD